MSSGPAPAAPTGGLAVLSAVLDDVLRTGADLAVAEVARTRALAAVGHLALHVMTDRRADARASEMALREVAYELAAEPPNGRNLRSPAQEVSRSCGGTPAS